MKLLHTTGYDGEPFSVPVDRIIALCPCVCQRFVCEQVEKTPGTKLIMQDQCPDGTAWMVRETYESIISKLEAL